MAQVVVTIAGRTYRLNCEDGQEGHLQTLAGEIDGRTGDLRRSFGEIGDQRLVVMTALTIADELHGARRRIADLERQATETDAAARGREEALEEAVENATRRMSQLLQTLSATKA